MARPSKVADEGAPKKFAHQDWFHIGNVGCSIFGFPRKSGDGLRYSYTITAMYTDKDGQRQRSDFFPAGEGLTLKAVIDEAERRIERNKELHRIRAEVHGEQGQAAPEAPPAEKPDAPIE
jgi:hypothetical protein